VKRETLKLSNVNGDEIINLYSLVTAESDLQVCNILNKTFEISLSLADDIIISNQTDKPNFKKYYFEEDECNEKYMLLVNRNANFFLVPELKKIDYFFVFISESKSTGFDKAIPQLKKNPLISAVLKIDHNTLRSFQRIRHLLD
jgi:hypothetical protein